MSMAWTHAPAICANDANCGKGATTKKKKRCKHTFLHLSCLATFTCSFSPSTPFDIFPAPFYWFSFRITFQLWQQVEIAFQFSFEPSPKMQIHNQLSAICCLFVCLVVCSVCLHTHDSNNFAFSRTVCRLLYFRCQGRSSPRWYLLLPSATPTSAHSPLFHNQHSTKQAFPYFPNELCCSFRLFVVIFIRQ